jgi:pyruvate/2-oxoacid:ferredoxin oxidoreductase alpha subunit
LDGQTEIKLEALKELMQHQINALKDLLEEKFDALDSARDLQANEYARRLGDLNNEAGRLREMQREMAERYMPREVYENQHKTVEEELDSFKLYRANVEGKASQATVFIAWGLAVIGLIIAVVSLLK